jgi:hypothetical protein
MERFKLDPIPISVPSEKTPQVSRMLAQKIDYEFERRNLGGKPLPPRNLLPCSPLVQAHPCLARSVKLRVSFGRR